jgi:3-mercaptopyruvate sulfurtransferase SseA
MRLLYTLAAAVVLAALALAACNSNDLKGNRAASTKAPVVPATPADRSAHVAPADGVKRVTTVELREALDKGTAVVVDVRPAQTYSASHIKGSISIPLDQVPARLSELPRGKMIVTYCS